MFLRDRRKIRRISWRLQSLFRSGTRGGPEKSLWDTLSATNLSLKQNCAGYHKTISKLAHREAPIVQTMLPPGALFVPQTDFLFAHYTFKCRIIKIGSTKAPLKAVSLRDYFCFYHFSMVQLLIHMQKWDRLSIIKGCHSSGQKFV